jgi:hypothetical protein
MTLQLRIIVLVLAALCLLILGLQVRHRQISAKYLVLWSTLCLLSVPLVVFPDLVTRLSQAVGIYYPPAALFLVAVVVLFLVSVHFSREITRLEERTRILAEELALARLESTLDDSPAASPARVSDEEASVTTSGAAAGVAIAARSRD